MSQSHKRFSREGFLPLAHNHSDDMDRPNDVTINIPMTQVSSNSTTGARKANALSPARSQPTIEYPETFNEKQTHSRFSGGPEGRRRKLESQGLENKDKDDGSLTAAGRFYMKIYNFSVITRYFLYVAPLALAIAIPIVVGATVAKTATIGGVRILWFFTWVEVVWVSLWVSKLFAQFLPFVFQFLCGVVSPGTRKYALIIAALEIPLSLVGWAATCLPTFVTLMTLNPDQRAAGDTALKPWQSLCKNILFACLFSTLIFFVEKLLIQLISISYHRKQFDDKIKDSKRNIYLVSLLYDASRSLFPAYCTEFAEEDYIISDVLDLAGGLNSRGQGHKRSGSATPMRLIQKVGRVGDKVTSAFGNVAQEITGKQVFNPTAAHSIVVQALEKKRTSEALARRLWLSFVLEGKDALYPDDIEDVLGEEHAADAEEAFNCLDADGNGDISLDEMILRLSEIGRERQSISKSMRDVDQAINVLDNLLCTVVFIVVVFIFVAWLNRNFTTTLATAGTALLSLSFVFAATAQEVLGSCIFLFVKHPYDVGDRVDISNERFVVERISLLYSIFRRVADHKRTQVPNIVLNSLWIDNVSRSKAMREQVLLYVSFDTSLEDLELLKDEMTTFVRDKDNARDFLPDVDVEVTGVAEMNKMELKIEIRHKSNWANEAIRATRRNKFMCALVLAMRKVPIYAPGGGGAAAGEKANPTYSVTISDDEASRHKEEFSENKDKKRMVPLLHKEEVNNNLAASTSVDLSKTTSSGLRHGSALEGLTKRNPASDPARDSIDRDDHGLERKRTNDIEEVRDILRRESTTGRRKASQQTSLSPQGSRAARFGSRTIPTIPDHSPLEPILQNPRVSYFEDSSYGHNVSQQIHPQQSQYVPTPQTYVCPTSVRQHRSGSEDNGMTPISQIPTQPIQDRPTTAGSTTHQNTPSRKPLPGVPELKNYLQSPKH